MGDVIFNKTKKLLIMPFPQYIGTNKNELLKYLETLLKGYYSTKLFSWGVISLCILRVLWHCYKFIKKEL